MGRSTRATCVSVVTLAAFLPLAVGCTSNEYVIPHDELARLAATPPPARGERVRVVQDLGGRRNDPVQMTVEPSPPQFVTGVEAPGQDRVDDGVDDGVNVQIDLSGDGQRPRRRGTSINSSGGSWSSPGRSTLQTWRAAPPQGQVGGGGGGRGISGVHVGGGGGGGGGGNGDAVLVAIIVVVAVVVAIGLVSSEGVRFDGYVAMSPEQPVHLRAANGQQATIPVADLSPGWVEGTVEAKVMDDEGFGLRRLDRLPLDRRGATFKLDSGTIAFDFAGATLAGPAMNIQSGYFFTRKLGLLANIGLAGGAATGGGVPSGGLVPRHALGLELQAFPLAWGPVHLGAFGNGGMAITEVLVGSTPTYVTGPSVGGGALAELDLTSRLALTLRAGGSLAKLDQIWTPAGQLTAGVAVY
ncbi:MAG TPA: hypothetical protein VLC06_09265 [Polyangia bacterium]|nr:hypothetical protein [Polyangia bacterium]